MTGGDREGQSVEAREECEDAAPGTSIGRRGAAVDEGRGAPAEGRGTSGWSGGKSEHQTGGAPGSPGTGMRSWSWYELRGSWSW